jgi:hypothetical protein
MKCYICGDNAISLHGRTNLCEKHKRFLQMQRTAKYDKKYMPSLYEIEALVPKDMICQDCGIKMNWINSSSRSATAVLQHYRDGSLGVVCHSCNVRHGFMPGDSYRDIPAGHKLCGSCKTIKPLDMFYKRSDAKAKYPMTKCKSCNLEAHREWRRKNPEKYKAINKKHNDRRKKNVTSTV